MRALLCSAAIAAAGATGAVAQSVFDGPYVGLSAGYGMGEVSSFAASGPDPAGFAGGVFAGFNASRGAMLYGAEIGASLGSVSDRSACINPTWTCSAEVAWVGTIRGRLGVVQGNTLFYATAGFAAADATLATRNSSGTRFPDSQTVTGWVAGLGIEGRLAGRNTGWRVEYLHHDFGRQTFATDVPYRARLSYGELRVGIVMGF
ncbi:MAG: outer membrane beta-barrel protein [Rhodobacteraceae bacterium]|jgi:outer membrane immunogenic protein|nr:outer membrane beta-barrel protein [Paracoccaceae bacterium]